MPKINVYGAMQGVEPDTLTQAIGELEISEDGELFLTIGGKLYQSMLIEPDIHASIQEDRQGGFTLSLFSHFDKKDDEDEEDY